MGRPRMELHQILKEMVSSDEDEQFVYHQPPNGLKMQYPCIVYMMDDVRTQHADNQPYRSTKRYQITVIDRDPDSAIPDKVATLPMSDFDRKFAADNLNHTVYNVYF